MSTRRSVVVVGAGAAGTLVATRLRELGVAVRLVEAGPRIARGASPPPIDEARWAYRATGAPFEWMRVRAVGGRALLWGGWAYRFPDIVFRRGGWPYGARALSRSYADVERRIGVVEGALDDRYRRLSRALEVRVTPKRGALTRGVPWSPVALARDAGVRVRTIATRIERDRDGGCTVHLVDDHGRALEPLRAQAVVLAASPLETARILRVSDLGGPRVGRGLVDHMVASYLLIEPRCAPSPRGRGAFPGAAIVESFVNVGGDSDRRYPGGFSIELTGPQPLTAFDDERLAMLGTERRDAKAMSTTMIHAIGELFPHRGRYMDLDPSERDGLGRPLIRVHLAWSGAERRLAADMQKACIAIADELSPPGGRLVPFLDPLVADGIGHEAGTAAMGTVCDARGRLLAGPNVWIADAAAMPTAGDRHPTLTLLAHALRVAEGVARRGG